MPKLPEGKSRLDLVREGLAHAVNSKQRGRLVVGIAKLKEDPRNERKTFRNMAGLIASIKAVGLVEPITVTPEPDDTYRIITGHRRFRAAQAAGLELVEVLIREPEDELIRRQKSVISNVQREDIGPVELADALQALMDEHPSIAGQGDLAKLIGKDKSWVSQMLRILDLPVALRRRVETSQLSVPYDAMAKIARLKDATQQARLIEAVLHGATTREIREAIGSAKGKGNADPQGTIAKPKRVYRTTHRATVIVQATGNQLTTQQCIEALREAIKRAGD